MPRRYRAKWMTGRDDVILEIFASTGAILNKKALELNFNYDDVDVSYSTLQRRLPKLKEAGLLELVKDDGKWYRITDKGEAYLDGEVNLSDEPEP